MTIELCIDFKKNVEVLIPENTVCWAGTRALYERFNDPRFERPRMNIVPATTKKIVLLSGGGVVLVFQASYQRKCGRQGKDYHNQNASTVGNETRPIERLTR